MSVNITVSNFEKYIPTPFSAIESLDHPRVLDQTQVNLFGVRVGLSKSLPTLEPCPVDVGCSGSSWGN